VTSGESLPVFFVISEEIVMHRGSYEPPEPDEYGCVIEIVAARNRSAARYLAWKNHRRFEASFEEWPKFSVRKLGVTAGPPRVMESDEADPWYRFMDADTAEASE
jgi:hypothetical protein